MPQHFASSHEKVKISPKDTFFCTIDADTLSRYFTLFDADLAEVERCRSDVNKLAVALQLCALRWRSHFLTDFTDVSNDVIETLSTQLAISDVDLTAYPSYADTRWEHYERLRCHLGFIRCDEKQRRRLSDYLQEQAAILPRSSVLHAFACHWLYQQRIVRPGIVTLRRIISKIKAAALERAYKILTKRLSEKQKPQLETLLEPAVQLNRNKDENENEGSGGPTPRSRLEQFKLLPRRESASALYVLILRLTDLKALSLADYPALQKVHPATRALLASWGYRYDVWSIRRFPPAKRHAILLAFLQSALTQTVDAVIEMQDKLITRVHNGAHQRREQILHTQEAARERAVEYLEALGSFVVDEKIPDVELRARIFSRSSVTDLAAMVSECQNLRASSGDGSHLKFLSAWYGHTRRYSPALLNGAPLKFTRDEALGQAVTYMREVNSQGRTFDNDAPVDFLPRRWHKYVFTTSSKRKQISRPFYELALLTMLNEKIKAGEVTAQYSRRWTDFEDYLIPAEVWKQERQSHYTTLGLPSDPDHYITQLSAQLASITAQTNARVPSNTALTIDREREEFSLSALEGRKESASVKQLKSLIESHLPHIDLVDLLIDIDNETDFLSHFISHGAYQSRLTAVERVLSAKRRGDYNKVWYGLGPR